MQWGPWCFRLFRWTSISEEIPWKGFPKALEAGQNAQLRGHAELEAIGRVGGASAVWVRLLFDAFLMDALSLVGSKFMPTCMAGRTQSSLRSHALSGP